MGLETFGVTEPRGHRYHGVAPTVWQLLVCGIQQCRVMYPLRVSKPSGVAHLEIKRTSREPFSGGCTKRKVVDPLRNVNPC